MSGSLEPSQQSPPIHQVQEDPKAGAAAAHGVHFNFAGKALTLSFLASTGGGRQGGLLEPCGWRRKRWVT
ncbi:hypothetical protein NDU88_006897 [Pleurodeles waltl]|uniref:Uncharacterized protein n=1 Tax=Pleurodeles waltl TaxID=8319 RepID=A0AAV7VN71_PLEWA|nr:hypothetical protein NDU88_006897 [Pleurodeles waltl]